VTGSDENHVIQQWRADVEHRAAGREHQVKRGTKPRTGTAPGMWRCEGRDQCKDQMTVWDCIAEVQADKAGSAGEDAT
jgi:hypothetical protein